MILWHGGDLSDGMKDTIKQTKGKWEYGPGLYLTTHYLTARNYAKGSRKFYRVTIEEGTDISDVELDIETVKNFLMLHIPKSKINAIIDRMRKGKEIIPAYIFLNVIINDGKPFIKDTNVIRSFLVNNGIDYSLVSNAFGWHEMMLVLFNQQKIIKIERIMPNDKIEQFDLPTKFE